MLTRLGRYKVQKTVDAYGADYFKLIGMTTAGEVVDLYDFNFETGDGAKDPAIIQIGCGNESLARYQKGFIFRDKIKFQLFEPITY